MRAALHEHALPEDFYDYLRKGEFRASTCESCGAVTFPVALLCRHCRSRTRLEPLKTDAGVLIEFARSHIEGGDSQFGFVEMGGVRLIGTFDPKAELKVGMRVRMVACGVAEDGRPFYLFSPAANRRAKSKTGRN